MSVRWLSAFGVLVVAVGACAAADDAQERLLGVWEAVKSDLPTGTTLAFQRGGALEVHIKTDKGMTRVDATWKLEGDRLTVQVGATRSAEGREVARVLKLTDKELTLKSENGKVEEFKHVAPKRP